MVVALMNMILKGRVADDRLATFCKFLEKQESYSRITLDQWSSFLDFCYECEDLSSYDESVSAWPVLIDEYVEFMEAQQNQM
jgi:Cullin binding